MLIEKTIPLSEYEQAQLAKSNGAMWITKLPLFLMRRIVVKNIASYRRPEGYPMPIIPTTDNDIEWIRHELDGSPNKVGVSVYLHKGCTGTTIPLLFFIHGGGFLGGDSLVSEGLMRHLSDKLGIICASVDYNVAPEVKHPTSLNDCCQALDYVLSHYPIDTAKVFLSGDSAGGNLAAAMTLKLQDEHKLIPSGQVLFYPVTDLDSMNKPSYLEKGSEYGGMLRGMKLSRSLYLPDKDCRKHPYVSPIHAKMDKPQPDALLLIAERDGLRSDGTEYAEKLVKAGGYARCVLYKGAFHSFINDLFRSDIADDAAEEMLTFIKHRIEV